MIKTTIPTKKDRKKYNMILDRVFQKIRKIMQSLNNNKEIRKRMTKRQMNMKQRKNKSKTLKTSWPNKR